MIYNNASIGDALFSGTPAGAGAITVSAGADRYSIDHNWIAGNLSTGDGGGMQQLGVSFNGTHRQQLHPVQPEHQPDLADQRRWHRHPGRQRAAHAQRHRVRRGDRLRLPARTRRRHRPRPGDRCQPDPRQQRRERQRRRHAPAADQWHRDGELPAPEQPVVRRERDQQHHRQQRRGLGRRRRVAAGRAEGELHQQHGDVQRHHGLGGRRCSRRSARSTRPRRRRAARR